MCSRCGADLGPLMRLAVKAWRLREAARHALEANDVERALGLASEAQSAHPTPAGESLRQLSAWLHAQSAEPILFPPDCKFTRAAKKPTTV